MKRKTKTLKKEKPKRNKNLIANAIILGCISVLVVSFTATLCVKLVEKDKKDNLLDEQSQVTLAPEDVESDEPTEGVGEEESDTKEEPTETPTEEAKLPTEWKFLCDGSAISLEESEDVNWWYSTTDTMFNVSDGDWQTGREYFDVDSSIHRDVLTYDFGYEGYVKSICVEAPKSFRVVYSCYNNWDGSTTFYEVIEYPAGIHDLVVPSSADQVVTVTVFYQN